MRRGISKRPAAGQLIMKRLLPALMAAVLAASALAGCSSAGGKEGQTASESAEAEAGQNTDRGADATPDSAQPTAENGEDGQNTEAAPEEEVVPEGAVLTIYCIGEDFKYRVQDYYPGYETIGEDNGKIGETEVRWHVFYDEEEYRESLEEMLKEQDDLEDDEKIDLFVADEAYLRDYVESSYTLDVKGDLGITNEELEDQFPYTLEIATDGEGKLRALTWQATPGVFAYRRSIAKEVLGTDDPGKVQEAVSDWERFGETAEAMKESGYYMLSGYDDAYQVFADNVASAWVEDGALNVDPHLVQWAELTREFAENGYTRGTEQWGDEWRADHAGSGEVFGFFYSSWGIRYTLQKKAEGDTDREEEDSDDGGDAEDDAESAYGDYAVCMGPEPCHFGGQWIAAAKGCDNLRLAASVMRALTCDQETMKKITLEIHEFTNTVSGMQEIAQSGYSAGVLGGQNPVPAYLEAAKKLTQNHTTSYDEDLDLGFRVTMREYITGGTSLEDALELFEKTALLRYEELEESENEENGEDQ